MNKDIIKFFLWVVCVTIWGTVCFILPDFVDNPIHNLTTALTIGAYLIALGGASFWLIYLLGINQYLTCIFLPIFAISGATISYFRVAFHATITPMIIDATLHTNGGTIAGVVSWQLFVWIFINFLFAIGFIVWRFKAIKLSHKWIHAVVGLVLLFAYYNANGHLRSSINQRFPYNVAHSFVEYNKQQQQLCAERQILSYHITTIPDSIDIVFILGEAVRADHIQLNGYERETTPLLAARNNVVCLPHIYSEYTYTATSVPVIMSPADSIHPERSNSYSSFIRIFNECGFHSAWLSNQDNGHTYVSFINEADTIIFPNAGKSVFVFDSWYDEQLLPPLDQLMNSTSTRNIYVLHTIGSHWYYNLHVPKEQQVYTPTTDNRLITNNSMQQIINSYDNTVRYMDIMLDSIIQRLESRCAIMIYLSDHGEALGENGNYLHASENEALHLPACIIWYSDKYASFFPSKVKALKRNSNKHYRTDFLYYSILSSAGIESDGNNSTQNIFIP